MKRSFWARRILFFILFGAFAIFVFGTVVMLLWNNILAPVINISTITFWQALGILVLSKILFGGFRGGWGSRRHYWKQRMMQKWSNMTPEEREKLKQEWQRRCGSWGYKGWQSSEMQSQGSEKENTESRI
ncbi:MAG TPA: hypothetical protein VGQ09_20775 [Chitinophagaceae bacterium]|jgi:hypothetical protein|nr:hypothetical protein [Chitinophagaceae bacterium]